jgi:hypothetical protein
MERLKTSGDFSFVFFRTLPGLNFAVIENCTFQNVKGPLCTTYQGTVFKLSNLSFAYLHRFSHFISFFVFIYTRNRKEKPPVVYIRSGRVASRFSTCSLGLPTWVRISNPEG